MNLPCAIRDLIPQKGKMSFDQILTKAGADVGESSVNIGGDNIFLDDNHQLSNAVLIEYINQLIAAIHGYNRKISNDPQKKGLFVGIQEAEFYQTAYSGDLLTLKAFTTEEIAQVTFVQGLICRDGDKIAKLVTKIYEVKDLADFDLLTNHSRALEGKSDIILNHHESPTYLSSGMQRKLHSYLRNTDIGDDFISFNIACPSDFDAFDGHFPENPILPGVVLIEIAGLALGLFLKEPVIIKFIKKMKISGVVLPGQVISCMITIDKLSNSPLSFSAVFKAREEREISRFTGNCVPKGVFDERKEGRER
jgi:3-hydroxymyristoyl/3-hydroxydecanoyl-(acyl carrier protein) dehydratase